MLRAPLGSSEPPSDPAPAESDSSVLQRFRRHRPLEELGCGGVAVATERWPSIKGLVALGAILGGVARAGGMCWTLLEKLEEILENILENILEDFGCSPCPVGFSSTKASWVVLGKNGIWCWENQAKTALSQEFQQETWEC